MAINELTVEFENLGRSTTRLESWSIDTGYLTSVDVFEFVYYDDPSDLLYGLELQPVKLLLGETTQLIGRIDTTDIGDDGSKIACHGRDYIADALECNVDPTAQIKDGMTLEQAIKAVASPVGITKVVGSDAARRNVRTGGNQKGAAQSEFLELKQADLKPESGQGIYDFLNRLVSRHGCTMQTGLDRSEIVLSAPNYEQSPSYGITRTRSGKSATIDKARATRDFSSFPTWTMFHGFEHKAEADESPKAAGFTVNSREFVLDVPELEALLGIGDKPGAIVSGRAKPSEAKGIDGAKLYRLLVFKDDMARNKAQVEAATHRAISERMKDTLQYRATLNGHRDPETGLVWSVDTKIKVHDEITNVFDYLWIGKRKLTYSRDGGAKTEIECWRTGSFRL